MNKVPAYLSWYFLKIRSHADENNYFVKRFRYIEMDELIVEKQMIHELFKAQLIVPSTETSEKTYKSVTDRIGCSEGVKETKIIEFPTGFIITPRGYYFIRETITQVVIRSAWTFVVALIGVLVGVAIDL